MDEQAARHPFDDILVFDEDAVIIGMMDDLERAPRRLGNFRGGEGSDSLSNLAFGERDRPCSLRGNNGERGLIFSREGEAFLAFYKENSPRSP